MTRIDHSRLPCETVTTLRGRQVVPWSAPRLMVWAVWGIMLVAALWFVAQFGSDVPYWDEWGLVPVLSHVQAVTLEWLWAPHNGHRIPLPRLVLLVLYKMVSDDFRVGMYVNVLALGFASAALIDATRRQRGYASIADAIFPLLLLHWGHYENFLWTWQLTQVMPTVIVLGLLALAVRFGAKLPFGWVLIASVAVLTLPLSGVPGLVYTLPLALWVGVSVAEQFNLGTVTGRIKALAVWATAALSVTLVGLYFHDYPSAPQTIPLSNPLKPMGTAIRFLAGGLGPMARELWPWSQLMPAVILGLAGVSVVRSMWRDGLSHRVGALVLFWVGVVALAASVGFGRPGVGFTGRYFLLAAPALCAVYVTVGVGLSKRMAQVAQSTMCALVFLAIPVNSRDGVFYGKDYHARMEAFRTDVFAGHSPSHLAADHGSSLCPCVYRVSTEGMIMKWQPARVAGSDFPQFDMVCFHDWLVDFIKMLKTTQNSDYRTHLKDTEDGQLRELQPSTLRLIPSRATGKKEETPRPSDEAALLLTLERPQFITAVRVYRDRNDTTEQSLTQPWIQVFWRLDGQQAILMPQRYVFKWEKDQRYETIWIYQKVDQLSLHLGDPNRQRQLDVKNLPFTLLVPVNSE